jgi:hypothetical protein
MEGHGQIVKIDEGLAALHVHAIIIECSLKITAKLTRRRPAVSLTLFYEAMDTAVSGIR